MLVMHELTQTELIVRIFLAVFLGGMIGLERGMKNRPAGFRTYMLVCLGSCIVMLINQYAYQVFDTGDPVRMGAQVVSGIGFLGAGTIIVTSHNQIKGLTTAAGLWAAACVGLAIGIGFYEAALLGGIAVFMVLKLLHRLDFHMRSRTHVIELYVELDHSIPFGKFLKTAREYGLELSDIQLEHENGFSEEAIPFIVTVTGKKHQNQDILIRTVRRLEGIKYLEIL